MICRECQNESRDGDESEHCGHPAGAQYITTAELFENQERMRELALKAEAAFEKAYPQSFSAYWRAEPPMEAGSLSLLCSAGVLIENATRQSAIAKLVETMNMREDREEERDGCTYRNQSVCKEGVFVILSRSILLLSMKDESEREMHAVDRTIESIYRFRDGAWRHIWGLHFFTGAEA